MAGLGAERPVRRGRKSSPDRGRSFCKGAKMAENLVYSSGYRQISARQELVCGLGKSRGMKV